jgi:hypothetical protein
MSARGLVSGVVYRPPVQKMSKSGRPYAFLTIRSGAGDAARWWRCFVFSEAAIADVMQLSDGESIAVTGEFDAEIYAPAGAEARISWKITADAVLSAKRLKPKEAKPKADKPPRRASPEKAAGAAVPLLEKEAIDDAIPF